ncbi:MAG: PIN domain-containing protein [Leptospiraceae bacterium]|nr:PIN domain-containing protein [Leptospiraceae bacterium]MCP5496780.1 PIN domain-containing protein [Leptospiraceae bacterium]
MKRTLIDSGPLYALFDASDKYHENIIDFLKNFSGELFTTNFVITEVGHLLRKSTKAQINLMSFILDGGLNILEFKQDYYNRLIELAKKYEDLPMDIADGSLIVISEIYGITNIITIDSDYYIYRTKKRMALNNIFIKYL